MQENNYITMWTAQADRVWDTIERDGVYYVKRKYVAQKYQDISWIFNTAYRFFCQHASQIIPRPKNAESPVWLYHDQKWAVPSDGFPRKKLEIPVNEIILFDLRTWSKILNMDYVGSDKETELFYTQCKKLGISDMLDITRTNFYPLQKKQLQTSWKHLFSDPLPEELYWQGAVWRIKKEWIVI